MEKVTIQEASHRLNVSQRTIRDCVRNGELTAHREEGPRGPRWVVELPDEGWVDSFKASIHNLEAAITPWWWPTATKRGNVHYVEELGIEEIMPIFLCGFKSENVWPSNGHSMDDRCPRCTEIATERDLPLWLEQ